jgi:signal transduction histidine kinase
MARGGSEKAVESCVSLITDEEGAGLGKVVALRDVTWRKHLEEQVRQSKKMEAIGRLAGGVAHSFNNLMTTALGHCDLMLHGMKPSDRLFANAQAIRMSVARTVKLTQQLLAFGRKQFLALSRVDLNAVVGDLEAVVRHMRGGVRLDLDLQPELGLTRADRDPLEEAILTLVRNACDAMPQGGRLTVRTANVELGLDYTHDRPEVRVGSYVLLAVSDTGVGMAQEAISHLFEPFNSKELGVGAGLGLAAVYGFVKQCGGDIDVRSQPEQGTTFHIYLPREEAGSENGKPPA